MKKLNLNNIFSQLTLFVILSLFLVIILFPLYYLVVNASLPNSQADNPNLILLPNKYLFENFKNSINSDFYKGLVTSILAILMTNFFRIILYTLGVFGIWFASKKFKKAYLVIFVIISMIPEITTYSSLARILNANFTITKAPIFSLISNQFFSFFNFYYLYKSINLVSIEKIRLAKIDNLSVFATFQLVFLPKLKMSYYLIIIFSSIQVWNDFLWPIYIFSFRDNQTISTWFHFAGGTEFGFLQNVQAAGALFAIIVPLFVYILFSPLINKTSGKNFS
ncbi:Uncharacterised protein [Mesomycoplasma conjunctivae]|uniref:Uncharacterized protein n=1 Tax=Mesomycoplasma conjunctivae (strain ATCC 25834 / NCTC 10147 / HRC/581) TaxID=572263 RepID=C5J6C4_MESCH|nr:carbohydrate ABC transporter permease [Mesomycoplasma conjunctivae]CAT05016.1 HYPOTHETICAL PROTEIN MCJ_003250 [Mesomycoplasma conjunctivae]VEU66325.1 Uncharacterised protein [Mesomycoplasma conjunctivae]